MRFVLFFNRISRLGVIAQLLQLRLEASAVAMRAAVTCALVMWDKQSLPHGHIIPSASATFSLKARSLALRFFTFPATHALQGSTVYDPPRLQPNSSKTMLINQNDHNAFITMSILRMG